MIYLVLTKNHKQLITAYFLTFFFKKEQLLIPLSNEETLELCKKTINYLKIPYQVIELEEIVELKKHQFSNRDNNFYHSINERTTLIDVALEKLILIHFLDKYTVDDMLLTDAYVISFFDDLSNQAVKFSILSKRPLVVMNPLEIEKFFKIFNKAKSYFISFSEELTTDDLINFVNTKDKINNQVPFSIMYPYGKIEREFFVIKNLLFYRFSYPYQKKNAFHFPLEYPSYYYKNEIISIYLGRVDDPEKPTNELYQPHSLLFTMSHSNGVDMILGDIVLCPRENKEINSPEIKKAMPCFSDINLCSRKSKRNVIFNVSQLKAKIVFFYTCWGLLLKNSLYDVRTSLARKIILSPYTGFFITSYTMSHLDKSIALKFVNYLNNNLSLSQIIDKINREHYSIYHDLSNTLVLLGDPEFIAEKNYLDNIENLLPKNILLYLNQKGIFYSHSIYGLDNKWEVIERTINSILKDIYFTKAVLFGSITLEKEDIRQFIETFSKFIDNFWSFLLLVKNRITYIKKQYLEINLIYNKLKNYLENFHENWIKYFILLNSRYGGLLRLQIDRYFHQSQESKTSQKKCPYCLGYLIKNTLSLVNKNDLMRYIYECFNCTTILDCMPIFKFAIIQSEQFWHKNVLQHVIIQLELYELSDGEYPYTASICIEPFCKNTENLAESFEKKGKIQVKDKNITFFNIELDNILLNNHYISGQYYLNALVIVQTSIAVLRKAIYLVNQEARALPATELSLTSHCTRCQEK